MISKRFLSFILFISLCLAIFSKEHKHVLVLHSYFPTQGWAYEVNLGLRSAFQNQNNLFVTLDIRYLDLRSENNKTKLDRLRKELIYSYNDGDSIDLIMAVDDYAWNFLNDPENIIFGQIPTIFCSAKNYRNAPANGRPFTGLNESLSFEESVGLIKEMLPRTKEVLLMCSENLPTGKGHLKELEGMPGIIDGIKINIWRDSTSYSLKKVLGELPPDAVLFYAITNFTDDPVLEMEINLHDWRFFHQFAKVPIFTHNFDFLEKGVLGGYMIKAYDTGFEAAQMALDFLNGKALHLLPVKLMKSRYIGINYRVVKEFDISDNRIPKNAELINFEPSLWVKYRVWFFVILMLFISLAAIAMVLAEKRKTLNNKLLKTTKEFEESKEQWLLHKASLDFLKKQFQAPLGAIAGLTQILKNPATSQLEKEQYLKIVLENAEKLHDAFLDIDELSSDNVLTSDVLNKSVNHHFLIKEIYEYALGLRNKQGKEHLSIALNIPDEQSKPIKTDSLRLKQLLIQQLNFLLEQEVSGIIEIGYLQSNQELTIFIKTNNTLISNAELSLLNDANFSDKQVTKQLSLFKKFYSSSKIMAQKIKAELSITTLNDTGFLIEIIIPVANLNDEKIN